MTVGVAALCLVLDAGFLGAGEWSVNPEAMSVLGTASRLEAELSRSPRGQRIDIVLEDDGSGTVAAAQEAAGRPFAHSGPLETSGPCAPDAMPLAITAAPRDLAGFRVWVRGDTEFGLGESDDADRLLREVLAVPVPRPLPPDMITGELLALSGFTDGADLLRATFEAERTSWAVLDGRIVLYSETSDQVDALLSGSGAVRLSHAVRTTRLRFVRDVPTGAVRLLEIGTMTLIEAETAEAPGMSWRDLRFATLR